MARLARTVVAGLPHHVTQRGNRRQLTFFSDHDYDMYLDTMAVFCKQHGVDIWGYCLMPNHVHLIAVPPNEEALAQSIGEAHRRYTRSVNSREGWTGHLWQGRFASYVMDEQYLLACVRYVEMNPVNSGLADSPLEWRWSSADAHVSRRSDRLVNAQPLLDMVDEDWSAFLGTATPEHQAELLRRHERTGRPLGTESFVGKIEVQLGRSLRPAKAGRKPRKARRGSTTQS